MEENTTILAFCSQGNGLGWAVLRAPCDILNWGVMKHKDEALRRNLARLLRRYRPTHIVLENINDPETRKGARALSRIEAIKALARKQLLPVKYLRRTDIRLWLGMPQTATKFEIASAVAVRLAELEHLRPEKRNIWQQEQSKLLVIMAVALSFAAL